MNECECVYVKENDTYRLSVMYDDYPDNPRTWDNLGTMVCWHRRYDLGDKHDFESVTDFYLTLAREISDDADELDDMPDDELKAFVLCSNELVILPLYLMDHSGLSMRTDSEAFRACDSAGWDWGQVGWIYVTMDKARREFPGLDDSEVRKRAQDILEAEVDTYNKYLHGDVYQYVLEKKEVCDKCKHVEYTVLEACGGIYTDNLKEDLAYMLGGWDLAEEMLADL